MSAKQNRFFPKENYVVINGKVKELRREYDTEELVYFREYDDLNKEFSNSNFIQKLIDRIVEKQDRLFILGFTSACLDVKNPKVEILGPDPEIATRFDSKLEQILLFEELKVPRNNNRVYNSIAEVKEKESYPFFIFATHAAGGHESRIVSNEADLDRFYSDLREANKTDKLLVADLITDIKLSPNVNALVVDENRTDVVYITDQVLNGIIYLGNIYPSKAEDSVKEEIIETTKIIGSRLAKLGFRGLFGLDFLIDANNKLYTIDLNPRGQDTSFCSIVSHSLHSCSIDKNLGSAACDTCLTFSCSSSDG